MEDNLPKFFTVGNLYRNTGDQMIKLVGVDYENDMYFFDGMDDISKKNIPIKMAYAHAFFEPYEDKYKKDEK